MTYAITLTGPPLSPSFTNAQTRAFHVALASLGNPAFRRTQGAAANTPATDILRKIPYFPRALWSAQSLCLTLYALLGPDCGGPIAGVSVTTEGGLPYQSRRLDQGSDEAQAPPPRTHLDVFEPVDPADVEVAA